MKKRRFVASLMTLAMLVSMLSGCSFGSSSKKVTQIYFLSCKPEVKSVWEEVSAAYEKETGIQLMAIMREHLRRSLQRRTTRQCSR